MASNFGATEPSLLPTSHNQDNSLRNEPKLNLYPASTSLSGIRDRSYHVEIWTKIFTTFAAIFFGMWSITSWKLSKGMRGITEKANSIASQALSTQIQQNQINLYSFCRLNVVFPPSHLTNHLHMSCYSSQLTYRTACERMIRALCTWLRAHHLTSLQISCHQIHPAALHQRAAPSLPKVYPRASGRKLL
jgi:hypothetical protein